MGLEKQKKYLAKLKKEDPEFYATIISTKGLLSAQHRSVEQEYETDEELEGDSAFIENEEESIIDDVYAEEDVHKKKSKKKKSAKNKDPSDSEEEDDDDDDDDDDEDAINSEDTNDSEKEIESETEETVEDEVIVTGRQVVLSMDMVAQWEKQLQGNSPEEAFRNVSSGLLAAVESLDCSERATGVGKFIVKSPSIFNQLVSVSLQYMGPALLNMLGISSLAHITSSRKFKNYAPLIKSYVQNLMKLYDACTSSSHRSLVLRRGVLPLLAVFKVQQKQSRRLVSKLVEIWATGQSGLQVLAFIAIFRMVKMMGADICDYACKTMYLAYVQHCRFTSPSNLPGINFMRVSLCELYSKDHALAYKHAFLYVRQMAFHLRNATIANKKEKFQLVYNWQFVHCLDLWCTLLSTTHPSTVLQPLVYPVVQVCVGTMKLQESPRYFPLVLHVSRMLADLSAATDIFIPVLPQLLRMYNELKTPKNRSAKSKSSKGSSSQPFACALKLSGSETGQLAVMCDLAQNCRLLIVRYLAAHAHNIAFPEMVVMAVVLLKRCMKRSDHPCVAETRQLLAHITQHAAFIEDRRHKVDFTVRDTERVTEWETETKKLPQLPIVSFYEKLQKESREPLVGETNTADKRHRDVDQQITDKKKGEDEQQISCKRRRADEQKSSGKRSRKVEKHLNSQQLAENTLSLRSNRTPNGILLSSIANIQKAKEKVEVLSLDDL